MSLKRVLKSFKVILVAVFLVMAVIAINPKPWADGVAIRSIAKNSSASDAGMLSPEPQVMPTGREVIHFINNIPIKDLQDYQGVISSLEPNRTLTIKTSKNIYRLTTKPLYKTEILAETITEYYNAPYFD